MTLIIAVDGPAASGKGTIAARLARTYGLPHLDTGLLYRAVGARVLEGGGSLDDEAAATQAARDLDAAGLSDDTRLTTGEAGEAASRVAGFSGVRAALLELQQGFAAQAGGAVLDGRDIGTVIAPDAPAKLFVTARARGSGHAPLETADGARDRDFLRRHAGRYSAARRSGLPGADRRLWSRRKTRSCWDTTEMGIEAAFDAARRIVEAARAKHDL